MAERSPTLPGFLRDYGIAVAAVGTALLLTFLVQGHEPPPPGTRATYTLFAAAVVVSASLGNLGSGLMATVLAALASAFFRLTPLYSLRVEDPTDLLRLGLFLIEGTCLSVLASDRGTAPVWLPRPRSGWVRYGLAAGAVLAALLFKLALLSLLPHLFPFLLFSVAVLFAVTAGGLGPGLFATLLSAASAAFFFFEPRFNLLVADPGQAAQLSLFVLEGTAITLIGSAIHALRQQAEANQQEIASQRERLGEADARIHEQAALLDQARDAILILDLQGHLRYWNRGAEHLYGRSAPEVRGQAMAVLLPLAGRSLSAILEAVNVSGEWHGELIQVGQGGKKIVVASRWTLLRDGQGHPCGYLMIGTDITERKKLEEQLFRAQRLDTIGTLATGIVHDLNNALTPLAMGVGLLKANRAPEAQAAFLDIFGASIDRATGLLRQILAFARGEGATGPQPLRPLIAEIERLLVHTLPRTIRVETSAPHDLWNVTATTSQLSQILMNLCVNARDAMPTGGRLTIAAENVTANQGPHVRLAESSEHVGSGESILEGIPPGPYVLLTVSDTGVGIAPEILARVFEPFFTTKAPGQGTGMGLTVVHGIVTGVGGSIRVESTVGQGTRFNVYLPASPPVAAPPRLVETDLPTGHGELVLIVDDEASVREMARRALEACGYRAITATSGQEALELLRGQGTEVRAVLLDVLMPELDGLETLRELRRLAPTVPVILSTGVASQPPSAPGQGETAILPKPYSAVQLLRTIQQVLQP
jgi:PAS domain S-box-containing protein